MLKRCVVRCGIVMLLSAAVWPLARAEACWFRPGCLQDPMPVAGETLPASFAVVGLQRCVGAKKITFSAERAGTSRPVDFDQTEAEGDTIISGIHRTAPLGFNVFQMRSPLEAGETLVLRYAVEDADADAGPSRAVEVRWPIGEDEQLPADLGKLNVRADQRVVSVAANGSCSRLMDSSFADVSLEPSEALKPWLPRLRFELRVDDNTWSYIDSLGAQYDTGAWYSSLGRGHDRVVLGCEVDPHRPLTSHVPLELAALEPGPHRVRMLGFLATGEELSSEEIIVDLQCSPDSARALKAQLDACADAKAESQANALAAESGGPASCSAATPGSPRSPGGTAILILGMGLCFCRRMRQPKDNQMPN